ncbi:MAG: hypothetical protein MJY83_07070 [Bacteroidales bacterium]|nr:hypothetical protein [Bacteroidales bacterium]
MKKILITALAAVFCFCSCMTSVEDYIYTIGIGGETGSTVITKEDPEGTALVKELHEAVDAFKSKNSGNWTWVETIYDGRISKADAAAQKMYDKYNAEFKSIIDTYQSKFNALPDKGSLFEASYDFKLYRTMSGTETLASTIYKISYGK